MTKIAKTLTVRQREKVADKLMTLGNIVFSGMVIAPLVSAQFNKVHAVIAFIGGVTFGITYLGAVSIMKGGGST